jgi:hypothetical protein
MAVSDQGMDLPREQINPSQRAHGPMACTHDHAGRATWPRTTASRSILKGDQVQLISGPAMKRRPSISPAIGKGVIVSPSAHNRPSRPIQSN